jgi:putative acetyltransferase
LHAVLETEVNEQNFGARAFYANLGFTQYAWTPDDGEGRAYPLIHLRLDPAGRLQAAAKSGT